MIALDKSDYGQYLNHVYDHPEELNRLIDVLTINVSRFFRKTLTFEYIAARILPAIVRRKEKSPDPSLRIWSAGCAAGEEPYSLAILMNELMEKYKIKLDLFIFATDIDEGVLKKAEEGVYTFDRVKNTKYHFLTKYFEIIDKTYLLKPEIKRMVRFSQYDLLDRNTNAPSESVFGDFDLVLCRNVLIYYNHEYQEKILGKLLRSLTRNSFLILGEAETLSLRFQKYFNRIEDYLRIYQKLDG